MTLKYAGKVHGLPPHGTPSMHDERTFDFPSSCPHFRMEMEARSIELALVQGISTRNYSGIARLGRPPP